MKFRITYILLFVIFPSLLFSQKLIDSLNSALNILDGVKKAEIHLRIGNEYNNNKEYLKALDSYKQAVSIFSEKKDQKKINLGLLKIADIHFGLGNYAKAIENYFSLAKFYDSISEKEELTYIYIQVAESYINLLDGNNALKNLNIALDLTEETKNFKKKSVVKNAIGKVYSSIYLDYSKAKVYYEESLEISENVKYKLGIARALHNLGIVNYNSKNLNEALLFFGKSLSVAKGSGIEIGLAYNYSSIANVYLELNKVDSAIIYYNQGLKIAEKEKIYFLHMEIIEGLSKAYKEKGNYKESLKFIEEFSEIRDKLYNQRMAQKVSEIQVKYETEKNENEKELILSNNLMQRYFFIITIVLLVVLGAGLLHRYRYTKKSKILLENLNATKDKLFSIIGHDLKNPFSSLINFSEMLIEDYDELTDEEKITYIQMMHESSRTGHELLDNLLQWSKTQSGNIDFDPQDLKLSDLVDKNIALLYSSAQAKKITIKSKIESDAEVFADTIMVKTVLRNLISNAIKFSKENSEINISSEKSENKIVVSVKDTGVGIQEENIGKIFDPKIYFSTQGTSNEPGTGLGLKLCQEFVEINGGTIWVESKIGEGSIFKFSLPLSKAV